MVKTAAIIHDLASTNLTVIYIFTKALTIYMRQTMSVMFFCGKAKLEM